MMICGNEALRRSRLFAILRQGYCVGQYDTLKSLDAYGVPGIPPVEQTSICATLADLRKIVQSLPHLDSSDTTFEADVMAAANSQPAMPKALSWE